MSTSPWQPLAQQILAIVDPLLEAATAAATGLPEAKPARCQQVWCPACATVAIASGEDHPLKASVAEHGAALLAVLRAMATTAEDTPTPKPPATTDADRGGTGQPAPSPGHYQPITITIDDGAPSPDGAT